MIGKYPIEIVAFIMSLKFSIALLGNFSRMGLLIPLFPGALFLNYFIILILSLMMFSLSSLGPHLSE